MFLNGSVLCALLFGLKLLWAFIGLQSLSPEHMWLTKKCRKCLHFNIYKVDMFKCLTEYESRFYFDRSLLRHIKSYTKYVMPDYSILSSRQSSFEIQINNCDSSVIQHQFKKLFSVLTDYHFMPMPWRL